MLLFLEEKATLRESFPSTPIGEPLYTSRRLSEDSRRLLRQLRQ
jgi:hypothetical protein